MESQSWRGGTDEEYETQHFGFGAQRLKLSIREMIAQKITTGVKDMESYLQDTWNLNDTDKATLTRSCDKVISLYLERAKPSLETIDREFEKILNIPPNVVLPEDEVQLQETTDEEYESLKNEVELLRKRVERAALMEALLNAEEEELSLVDKVSETAENDMKLVDVMQKHIDQNDVLNTVKNTRFLCDTVPFMKDYLEDPLLVTKEMKHCD